MNRISVLAIAVVAGAGALSLARAEAPPTPQQEAEKAVKTRQGLFDVQSFAFGPVGAMLKGAPLDLAVVQKEAARVQVTASMIPEVFALDTRKFTAQTKAREDIWLKQADFKQKASDLQSAAAALESAAKKGDKAAVMTAANAVGQACKACHDNYREK